jgi:hypothetical protein
VRGGYPGSASVVNPAGAAVRVGKSPYFQQNHQSFPQPSPWQPSSYLSYLSRLLIVWPIKAIDSCPK